MGWVRLNTDGSCRDNGHIGCGDIIRGSDGEWIGLGGYTKFVAQGNAYLTELWGVFEGLKVC
jgi:ribonuclease HI